MRVPGNSSATDEHVSETETKFSAEMGAAAPPAIASTLMDAPPDVGVRKSGASVGAGMDESD